MISRQNALPLSLPPRLIAREAAAAYVGVSPNTFDAMIAKGLMPRPRLLPGYRRKVWDVCELNIAIDALPRDGDDLAPANEGWT